MDFLGKLFYFLTTVFFYVAAESAEVVIVAYPQTIRIGLTTEFSVQCDVLPSHHDTSLSKILKLSVKKVTNGIQETLAEITPSFGAGVTHRAAGATAHGSLKSSVNYLNVTWKNPEQVLAGEYVCECVGADTYGNHVIFTGSRTVSYDYPTRGEYIASLFELHAELDAAYAAGNRTQIALENAQKSLSRRQLPDNCNPPVVNATGCSDASLSVGYHVLDIIPKDGLGPIKVLCHVRIQGEGWIVFQKRFDGSVDFYRNFHEYEVGFGTVSPTTEFWLGLENLRRLLVDNGDENGLRVDLTERGTAFNFSRTYPIFRVGSGDGYVLIAEGYSDGGKGMSENSGARFSTYDNDHSGGCPSSLRLAGWWFHEGCGFVNLNGLWALSSGEASIFWYEIYNHPSNTMQATEMKFRPFPAPIRK